VKLRGMTPIIAVFVAGVPGTTSHAADPPTRVAVQGQLEFTVQGRRMQSEPAVKGGAPRPKSDPNDFYYYEGAPVRLDRSLTEVVVRFKALPSGEKRKLVESVSPLASLGPEMRTEGRTFHVVTIPATAADGGLALLVDQLRSKHDVEFVAAVFYHPETRQRMLPTDEIVVKVKAGRTRQELVREGR
jgi:hypothetical protein